MVSYLKVCSAFESLTKCRRGGKAALNRQDIDSSDGGEVMRGGEAIHGDFGNFSDFLRNTYYLPLAQINQISPNSINSGPTNTQNQIKIIYMIHIDVLEVP